MGKVSILLLGCLAATSVLGQESTSYRITDYAFNNGGHPKAGVVPTSTSFRITLAAIGDPVAARFVASASYQAKISLGLSYTPPGEVVDLRFTDGQTLVWNTEPSVGSYNLYRDLISDLSGLGYGLCTEQGIDEPTMTDADAVPLDDGFFYLITAANLLDEEGPKGEDSLDTGRTGNVCP